MTRLPERPSLTEAELKDLLRRAYEFLPQLNVSSDDEDFAPRFANQAERLRYEADKLERGDKLRSEINKLF